MERRYLVRRIDRPRAPVIRPAAGLTIAYRLPCGTASKRANVDHQIRLDDPAEANKSTGRPLFLLDLLELSFSREY